MISSSLLPRRQPSRQWWIYESSDRWARVVRRLVADFVTGEDPLSIVAAGQIDSNLPARIRTIPIDPLTRRVVLWQVDGDVFQDAAAAIPQFGLRHPRDLQIAAVNDLSASRIMTLSELGIATTIRRPEQLPSLGTMISRHFARQDFDQ